MNVYSLLVVVVKEFCITHFIDVCGVFILFWFHSLPSCSFQGSRRSSYFLLSGSRSEMYGVLSHRTPLQNQAHLNTHPDGENSCNTLTYVLIILVTPFFKGATSIYYCKRQQYCLEMYLLYRSIVFHLTCCQRCSANH